MSEKLNNIINELKNKELFNLKEELNTIKIEESRLDLKVKIILRQENVKINVLK